GTPAYMAPEQMRGEVIDARGDQFAFCVSLYEALYGERPYEGRTLEALVRSLRSGTIQPAPKGSPVPRALRRVLLRGLAIDPAQRWPTMEALLGRLAQQITQRRRAWWSLGLLAGLVAGIGLSRSVAAPPPCTGAREHLDGIWDAAQAERVRGAILATELSYASDTWERARDGLDRYAAAWVDAHTEACEATSVRGEQSAAVMDLRMACLDERRLALREAVEVLAEADATRVEHALELISSLPAPSGCDDGERLGNALSAPEEPELADAVETQRERLAHAIALLEAGAYDDGLAEAQAVVEQAQALGHPPLRAEALLTRARARRATASNAEAEQDAEEAYFLAMELGHVEVEVRAATLLVWLVGFHRSEVDEGLRWGRAAQALAARRGADPARRADALNGIGAVLMRGGRREEAREQLERALAIYEGLRPPELSAVAQILGNLCNLHRIDGDFDGALACYRRALAIEEDVLGPAHPAVGKSLGNIGGTLADHGELDEALEHHRRALEVLEAAGGPEHPEVATSLANLGIVRWRQGRLDEALPPLQRALGIFERAHGPDHLDVAMVAEAIGGVLWTKDELPAALEYLERALSIRERALGPDHPEVAKGLLNVGVALWKQGKVEEALARQERALEIFEATLGPTHPNVAQALVNLAEIKAAQGRVDEALVQYRRGLALLEETFGPEHPRVVAPKAALAELERSAATPSDGELSGDGSDRSPRAARP
ncbi:MAG: tetratricopeptide repeat protein, partial [Myxococcales bacterium]|nr:tetratricopeptide repeat protein [Myxococcales bacterium]